MFYWQQDLLCLSIPLFYKGIYPFKKSYKVNLAAFFLEKSILTSDYYRITVKHPQAVYLEQSFFMNCSRIFLCIDLIDL